MNVCVHGNRTKKTEGTGSPITYSFDRTDQLIDQAGVGGSTDFTYNEYGDLLTSVDQAGGQQSYAYDLASRQRTLTAGGSTATFTFDGLGRIKTRTAASLTQTYGYRDTSETVVSIAGSGTSTRLSALAPDGSRIATKDGTTGAFLLFDPHGSVVGSEPSGSTAIANAIRYDGYGVTLGSPYTAAGAISLDTKYGGRLDISPALGFAVYEWSARLYAPGLGTFTALDTYGGEAQNPRSMNRFVYAQANPTSLIDPTGHRVEWGGGGGGCIPSTCKPKEDQDTTPYNGNTNSNNTGGNSNGNGNEGGGDGADSPTTHETWSTPDEREVDYWATKAVLAAGENRPPCAPQFDLDTGPCVPVEEDSSDGHFALDVVGFLDPTGIADGINGLWYLGEGDLPNAGISAIAIFPYVGDVGKLGKYGAKAIDAISTVASKADNAGALAGRVGDMPIAVIGRQSDTAVAKDWLGHEVLDIPQAEWTLGKNDEWVSSVVERKMDAYVGSPTSFDNLWSSARGRPTVFGRELGQLQNAGYRWDGWYLRAPR